MNTHTYEALDKLVSNYPKKVLKFTHSIFTNITTSNRRTHKIKPGIMDKSNALLNRKTSELNEYCMYFRFYIYTITYN